MSAPDIIEPIESPALVPGSEPMRFVTVDARHSVYLWLRTVKQDSRWPPTFPEAERIQLVSRTYALRRIGWVDVVFVADTERGLLDDALRAVEGVLLFLVWLFGEHEIAGRPVAARMLDALLEGSSFGEARRIVPMMPGDVERPSLLPLPEGMREETDAEFRARLRAKHEGGR